MTKQNFLSKKGFTIVELMVTVAVLVILAGIAMYAQASWNERTQTAAVKNDLTAASTAMENARNFDNGYPTSVPDTFKSGPSVDVTYHSGDSQSFCLDGRSSNLDTVRFHIDHTNSEPQPGTC